MYRLADNFDDVFLIAALSDEEANRLSIDFT
jgi:hypothetical protein